MLSLSMHRQNFVKILSFILKMLSRNEILILFKGRNSVMNIRKLTFNNTKLDVVNIYAYAKFGQNPLILLKILSGNEILISLKCHNSVIN